MTSLLSADVSFWGNSFIFLSGNDKSAIELIAARSRVVLELREKSQRGKEIFREINFIISVEQRRYANLQIFIIEINFSSNGSRK